MKKTKLFLVVLFASMSAIGSVYASDAKPDTDAKPDPEVKEIPAEIKVMLDRLEEIKGLDKSDLNRHEKKALRKEVRAMKAQIKSSGNGIYISTGAIIIILLLIIIL
ncbi:MAG: hypothetical protein HKP38_06820 [Croceitalea sp.]|nr:hypothetical protein [Croceitalea sp.]MBT8239344.1 hypothetical protein [Croceitalea sp.]NNC33650.1 hypothetical protein [Croceitalea sp.]NNL08918.1 hypothetical protein [Croceitalea sp.]